MLFHDTLLPYQASAADVKANNNTNMDWVRKSFIFLNLWRWKMVTRLWLEESNSYLLPNLHSIDDSVELSESSLKRDETIFKWLKRLYSFIDGDSV